MGAYAFVCVAQEKQREGSQLLKSVISSWLRNTTQGALSRWKLFTLTAAHEANQQHMAADLRKVSFALSRSGCMIG